MRCVMYMLYMIGVYLLIFIYDSIVRQAVERPRSGNESEVQYHRCSAC